MNWLDAISECLEKQFPFVIFRKPNDEEVVGWFQYDNEPLSAGHRFVFAPFHKGEKLVIYQGNCRVMSWQQIQRVPTYIRPLPSTTRSQQNQFEQLVEKAIQAIQAGIMEKVVLSRTQEFQNDLAPLRLFERLMQQYPTAFVSMWYHPVSGCWLGATPEQLLRVDDGKFYTMALAGTQAYQKDKEVVWGQKEIDEQQFVTTYIVNKLIPITSKVTSSSPYSHRAGNLVHIRTDIVGEIHRDHPIEKLVRVLHPTPAICGMPKDKSLEFILENEGYDRSYYSGYLGEISEEDADLYVNLRCMKWEEGKAHLYMGCGITKESDPHAEFLETVNKSNTIAQVFGKS